MFVMVFVKPAYELLNEKLRMIFNKNVAISVANYKAIYNTCRNRGSNCKRIWAVVGRLEMWYD